MTSCIVFGGQSTQADHMCLDLWNHPETKRIFDCAGPILGNDAEWLVTEATTADLKGTYNCQRALYLSQMIHYSVYRAENPEFQLSGALGHSVGIAAALTVAGCLTLEEGLFFIKERAKAFSSVCEKQRQETGLAAVKAKKSMLIAAIDEIDTFEGVSLALHNTMDQLTVGGSIEKLIKFQEFHEEKKNQSDWPIIKCSEPLEVEAAYHTSIFKPATEMLSLALRNIKLKAPKIGLYMGTSGNKETIPQNIAKNLLAQATQSELHYKAVWSAFRDAQNNFIEISHNPQPIKWFKKILIDDNFKPLKSEFRTTSIATDAVFKEEIDISAVA